MLLKSYVRSLVKPMFTGAIRHDFCKNDVTDVRPLTLSHNTVNVPIAQISDASYNAYVSCN